MNSTCKLTEVHGDTPAELASQIMQNPQVLASLQQRLGSMVGASSGYIQRYKKIKSAVMKFIFKYSEQRKYLKG